MSPYVKRILNEQIADVCNMLLEIKYPDTSQEILTEALLIHWRDLEPGNAEVSETLEKYRKNHRIFVGDYIIYEEPRNP